MLPPAASFRPRSGEVFFHFSGSAGVSHSLIHSDKGGRREGSLLEVMLFTTNGRQQWWGGAYCAISGRATTVNSRLAPCVVRGS